MLVQIPKPKTVVEFKQKSGLSLLGAPWISLMSSLVNKKGVDLKKDECKV